MNTRGKYYVTPVYKTVMLCALIFLFAPYKINSQISYGGRPAGLSRMTAGEIPVVTMPEFDLAGYLREKKTIDPRLKSLVFARPFELNLTPSEDGIWDVLPDGKIIWQIAIQSKGAFSLNVIFSRYRLEEGVSVFIYNAQQTQTIGSFNHRNNQRSGSLATSPVSGDMLIVEMQVEKGVENYGELVIGTLNHDFTGIMGLKDSRFGVSGDCNPDINCPQGNILQKEKNSVARILVNGNTLCSGVLVNNVLEDGRPYLLTANHCIEDSAAAASTVFIFGYESAFCNGSDGTIANSISGSELLSTQENLDFSLVELSELPPASFHPWYAGWDRSGTMPVSTSGIHHPSGDVKKVAADFDPPITATFGSGYTPDGHWQIEEWDIGTTESGSSGSPLFDHFGNLKGVLTGGDASCGKAVDDFYTKLSMAWETFTPADSQLGIWLDPTGTGPEIIGGLNPYRDSLINAEFTISTIEICAGDVVVFNDFSSGNPVTWLWDFGEGASPRTAATKGPHYVTYANGGTRIVSLAVQGSAGSSFTERELDLVVKTSDLPVSGFISTQNDLEYQFYDQSEFGSSYYWEFGDGNTSSVKNPGNTYSSEGIYTVKQLVRNRACSDTTTLVLEISTTWVKSEEPYGGLKVYPVPANDYLIIENDRSFGEGSTIEVLSVSGASLFKIQVPGGRTRATIETGKYHPGTYILKIVSENQVSTFRIAVIR